MKLIQSIFSGVLILWLVSCNPSPGEINLSEPISATQQPPTSDQAQIIVEVVTDNPDLNSELSSPTDGAYSGISSTDQPESPTTVPVITKTPRPTPGIDDWQKLPVNPEVSDKVVEIYQNGLALGNDPHKFSKVGDCGSTPAWFLGDFDRGPDFYNLGDHPYLDGVIDQFQGSFERTSLAARSGFNASSLFSPLWSDRTFCQANKSPLACEYRVYKPTIAFIMLGTNDIWKPEEFEPQMRKIVEFSIENGVIPIISTKADNAEGDHYINMIIARLAWEYEIPLLNYWRAVQALPDQGLQEDGAHLTWGRNFLTIPQAMSKAWPVRNLTALQALDAVWTKIKTQD